MGNGPWRQGPGATDEAWKLAHNLAHAARAYKGQRNYMAMADMLERISKECGNVHTNQCEFMGNGGGAINYRDVSDMTDEQLEQELK